MAHHVFPPPDAASDVFHNDDASSGDAGLVARAQRGDGDAFATLFDRHAPRVYALAYRILGRDSEAEDVTQDAFLHALNALPTLRRGDAFRPWVMRIATNLAWTTLRQRQRLPQAELTDAVVATHPDTGRWGSPEAMGLAAEDQRAVRLTLDLLAPTHRAALAMREIGGLSYADIAASLGTTTSSVEVLLFRARARFRDEYRKVALGAGAPSVGVATALRCGQTSRVLAVLADHEGSDEERRRAAAHARQCARCAARLQGRTDSRTLLLALPLTVPATLKSAVLSRAAPLLVAHAATASAAGGALTAGGGVSAGGAGAGVVIANGAAGGAGGTLAGASTSFVSLVGAGGLAAKIAALALMVASVAAVVVVTHAPARPTPRSSAHARRVTTAATPGSGAITGPSGRSSPVVQAVRPPVAATAVSSTAARSPAALHRSPATPVTGHAIARGTVGARGPGAVRTAGALRGTPPPMSAFGARSGATGRATAAAHNARASATMTSNGGAAGTITPATRLAGGPTATMVTSRRSGTRITPALATSGARGSGGVAGDAAGTATAAAPLAPPARRTPAASTVAATPVRAGSPLTTTPVPAARPAVSSSATPTAQSTGQGTTRRDATLTPRPAKPAITRAHNGRPARAGSRSVTAVPTTSRHAGRYTNGVAVRSPAPGRRSPRARPPRAATRAVRPPPVTTRVATPSTGHGAGVVATLTALPGSAATTIAPTVASAPTVVATLIPLPVLPTITTVAPRVTPGVPPAVRATITVLPRPTRPGVPTVPPLPTLTPVMPPLPTVPVVTPPTPAPTVPAALPSSSPTLTPTIAVPTLTPTIAVPTLAPTIAVPTLAPTIAVPTLTPTIAVPTLAPTIAVPTLTPTIAVPTLTPTIAVPTTATATLGLLPRAVPAVPVPPDGSNAPPMVPVVGISTLPVTTATPITTATAPATATASATGSFTLLPALLIGHDIGTVGMAGRTLDVAGLHTIARGLGRRYRGYARIQVRTGLV